MKLIIVAGMPGTGKEEFLTAARKMDISFLRMGDIVREYYATRDSDCESMNVGQFAGSEREKYGTGIWAERALERMSGDIFLVDGCRSMDEVRAYRELTPDVNVVSIHSSPEVRFERLVKRGRDDAPKNREEFESRDSREISWGLAETIAMSDIMLVNDGTLEEFYQRSTDALERMKQ